MSVARRRLVFEGRHTIAAVLLADTQQGREHVLAWWRPGARVTVCAQGLLVRLPAPIEVDCDALHGKALIDWQGLLVGVPATARELEALQATRGSVVLARAGRLVVMTEGQEVDPSQWLEVPAARVVEVPRPTVSIAPLPAAPAPRPLELKPDPEALPPEASRVLTEALQSTGQASAQPFWRRAFTSALRWWRARRTPGRERPPAPEQPGPLARLEGWTNRQLDRTPVGRWLDDFNRTYVDRLLRMFEREALDDALKHAVPLSRKQAEPGAAPSHLPLGPRPSISVNFGGRARDGAPSAVMRADVYEALKARYRAAATKLEEAGRIDEAAFVLADLLDAPQEAVDLFERHGRFDKAARLAEGRSLAPELIVRLWVLANDLPRATTVARRHRVFAAAVARLERGHLAQARVLRLQWGEWLASSGDFGGAVQAVAPLKEARPLMLKWVDLGIEAGGPQRPALLVRRLELEPGSSAPHLEQAHALLADGSELAAGERAALGEALVSSTDLPSLELRKPLVRAAIRALVRDEATWGVTRPGLIGRLLAFDDGPLRADVPNYAPGVRRAEASALRFERDGAALTPFDAVLLPSGALLVALGESGVALVGHDGRVKWRGEVPAHALVASDEGPSLLALAPREDVTTISRVTLAPKQAVRWADVQLSAASGTLGGGVWFIAAGHRVLGLDVLGAQPTPLWELSTPGPGVSVKALAASSARVSALTSGLVIARRTWRLPAFDDELLGDLHQPDAIEAMAVEPDGAFVLLGRGAGRELRAWTPGPNANQPIVSQPLPGRLAGTPSCLGATFAVPVRWRREAPDQVDVLVRPGDVSLGFGQAARAHTRFQRNHLVIACDNGHVVVFDCAARRVLRDVTVRP
jgi:hypothetical protein